MAIIYLVRHGQASFGADDYDKLSERGIEQATLVGSYLKNKIKGADHFVAGTMKRHAQTAQFSLSAFDFTEHDVNSTLIKDERWNEYDSQNIISVLKPELSTPKAMREYLARHDSPTDEFKNLFISAINQWSHATESAPFADGYDESFAHFSQRVINGLNAVAEQYQGKKVIVYTSGGPISVITSHLLGIPLERFVDINWGLVNAGVTKVVYRRQTQQLSLSTLNEHDIFEQGDDKRLITYT